MALVLTPVIERNQYISKRIIQASTNHTDQTTSTDAKAITTYAYKQQNFKN